LLLDFIYLVKHDLVFWTLFKDITRTRHTFIITSVPVLKEHSHKEPWQ